MVECHVFRQHRLRFIPIPKNAGTSILAACYGMRDVSVEQVHAMKERRVEWTPEGFPTFAVLRHPFSRMLSAWMNKVHTPHRPDTWLIREGGFTLGMGFEAFLDKVASDGPTSYLDKHLHPQVDFLPSAPVTLLRFEHLVKDWESHGFAHRIGLLPHMNATGVDAAPYLHLAKRILALYPDDLELYANLRSR